MLYGSVSHKVEPGDKPQASTDNTQLSLNYIKSKGEKVGLQFWFENFNSGADFYVKWEFIP